MTNDQAKIDILKVQELLYSTSINCPISKYALVDVNGTEYNE